MDREDAAAVKQPIKDGIGPPPRHRTRRPAAIAGTFYPADPQAGPYASAFLIDFARLPKLTVEAFRAWRLTLRSVIGVVGFIDSPPKAVPATFQLSR